MKKRYNNEIGYGGRGVYLEAIQTGPALLGGAVCLMAFGPLECHQTTLGTPHRPKRVTIAGGGEPIETPHARQGWAGGGTFQNTGPKRGTNPDVGPIKWVWGGGGGDDWKRGKNVACRQAGVFYPKRGGHPGHQRGGGGSFRMLRGGGPPFRGAQPTEVPIYWGTKKGGNGLDFPKTKTRKQGSGGFRLWGGGNVVAESAFRGRFPPADAGFRLSGKKGCMTGPGGRFRTGEGGARWVF